MRFELLPLKKGDYVDIIAPSSKTDPAVLPKIDDYLTQKGLRCRLPENLFDDDLLCANSDENRLQQLTHALCESPSRAIWCVRGGYGASRLIPGLLRLACPSQPKLLIGLSDITALQLFLSRQWRWPSLHAPTARQIVEGRVDEISQRYFSDLIIGQSHSLQYHLQPINQVAKQIKTIEAPVTGGNLALVQCSLATQWTIEPEEKIIFLEEIDEEAYRVDRMLEHLHQANVFDRAKALILGDFINNNDDQYAKVVLKRFAETLNIPVCALPGIGHGERNLPLPMGIPAQLTLGEKASILFE